MTRKGHRIIEWDLIDLIETETKSSCVGRLRDQRVCGKKASFQSGEDAYCKSHSPPDARKIKKIKANHVSPFVVSQKIREVLDGRPELLDVDEVILENQPSQMNPMMKTVQMLIFGYFAYKTGGRIRSVSNINAKQKEKLPLMDESWKGSDSEKAFNKRAEGKKPYDRRKILCHEYAMLCLQNCPDQLTFLASHKKQFDLADCFLQGTDWLMRNA